MGRKRRTMTIPQLFSSPGMNQMKLRFSENLKFNRYSLTYKKPSPYTRSELFIPQGILHIWFRPITGYFTENSAWPAASQNDSH
jgi:hypothetical protein